MLTTNQIKARAAAKLNATKTRLMNVKVIECASEITANAPLRFEMQKHAYKPPLPPSQPQNATQLLAAVNATGNSIVDEFMLLKQMATIQTSRRPFTGGVTCFEDPATGDVVGLQFEDLLLCSDAGRPKTFVVPSDRCVKELLWGAVVTNHYIQKHKHKMPTARTHPTQPPQLHRVHETGGRPHDRTRGQGARVLGGKTGGLEIKAASIAPTIAATACLNADVDRLTTTFPHNHTTTHLSIPQLSFTIKSNSSIFTQYKLSCGTGSALTGVDLMPKLSAFASMNVSCRAAGGVLGRRRLMQPVVPLYGLDPVSFRVNVTTIRKLNPRGLALDDILAGSWGDDSWGDTDLEVESPPPVLPPRHPAPWRLATSVVGGGIFTSETTGAQWTRSGASNRFYFTLAASADAQTLYAGTYYNGRLWKSTDFGATWNQVRRRSSVAARRVWLGRRPGRRKRKKNVFFCIVKHHPLPIAFRSGRKLDFHYLIVRRHQSRCLRRRWRHLHLERRRPKFCPSQRRPALARRLVPHR